jgi:hypothetical protein
MTRSSRCKECDGINPPPTINKYEITHSSGFGYFLRFGHRGIGRYHHPEQQNYDGKNCGHGSGHRTHHENG